MILVTGANGNLGAATLTALHARGALATGGSRTPTDGMRRLDFDAPSGIDLTGVSTLVLVSAGYAEDDQVVGRHAAVLDAAVQDGVRHVVYTSLTGAGDHLAFALAHRATERLVRTCGLPWTILRNGLYAELFGGLLMWADDVVESAFGDGALAAVARADLAEAAAIVAADPAPHGGRAYDLVGTPITAARVADQLGVPHRSIGLGEYRRRLLDEGSGLLPFQPPMLASIATSVRHRFLDGTCSDLVDILGRPLRDPLTTAAAAAAATRPAPDRTPAGDARPTTA
ncbi:NmrA family transcriptional regulator [Streptomyces sp. 8K308]|uniref:NmrA family NAD(P)-binding protein n=1 Tax=Streptomyces sp. 8K308 TaxID=2530388 RepID=UPI001047D6A2|nr:NmrA family NAD(P)-binding protein [Streptomyces sp. 8K308]TDC26266.1 NmrA family transcriptional regulator [Streptomyces sp. 8K308]